MRLWDRIREREVFRTTTPHANPVGAIYHGRWGHLRITRHKPIADGWGTVIVYGVQQSEPQPWWARGHLYSESAETVRWPSPSARARAERRKASNQESSRDA